MANDNKEEVEVINPSKRPPFVELKDGQIIVKTISVTMSRKHKCLMIFDLLLIGFVCGVFSYVAATQDNTIKHLVGIITVGAFLEVISIMKTITDFLNWKFTMNSVLQDICGWYVEDVRNIVSDLLNAGAKFAEEEVAKATGKEVQKEKEKENAS